MKKNFVFKNKKKSFHIINCDICTMSFNYNTIMKVLLVLLAIAVLIALVLQYQKKNRNQSNLTLQESSIKEDFMYPPKSGKSHKKDGKIRKEGFKQKDKFDMDDLDMLDSKTQNYDKVNNNLPKITQPVKASKQDSYEHMTSQPQETESYSVKPTEDLNNEDYKAVDFESSNKAAADCYPRDRLKTDDLLPKDAANAKWADANPAGQGDVKDQNYLQAGIHFGINTVGGSLRNANLQFRSDPPIPKIEGISPWNNTTIEYDSNRRFFEIGNI